jgi:DNA primase
MCLWYNLGVPAMSLQGEGYIPKPQVMKQVIERFKTVYLWYDNDFTHKNDNPGQDNAKKLIELYPKLHNIVIPDTYRSKDPSDLVKNHGVEQLKTIWQTQK